MPLPLLPTTPPGGAAKPDHDPTAGDDRDAPAGSTDFAALLALLSAVAPPAVPAPGSGAPDSSGGAGEPAPGDGPGLPSAASPMAGSHWGGREPAVPAPPASPDGSGVRGTPGDARSPDGSGPHVPPGDPASSDGWGPRATRAIPASPGGAGSAATPAVPATPGSRDGSGSAATPATPASRAGSGPAIPATPASRASARALDSASRRTDGDGPADVSGTAGNGPEPAAAPAPHRLHRPGDDAAETGDDPVGAEVSGAAADSSPSTPPATPAVPARPAAKTPDAVGPAAPSAPAMAPARTEAPAPTDGPAGAPVLPPTVADQIVSAVVPLHGRGDGRHEVTLELRPEELGAIRVEVSVEHQTVHLTLHAAEPATGRLLSAALPELRSALADAGLTAGHVGVGPGGGGGAGHRRASPVRREERATPAGQTTPMSPVRTVRPAAAGRLDVLL